TLEEAERILMRNKVEKLLLVDDEYRLRGLITIKDIDKLASYPNACKDARGRLRVGAAVGVFDFERAESLIRAGVDVLVVDNTHGRAGTGVRPRGTGVREVMADQHTASFHERYVTPDHRYYVGDLTTTSRETVTSKGYAAVLTKPTKRGTAKLLWQEVGSGRRA